MPSKNISEFLKENIDENLGKSIINEWINNLKRIKLQEVK